MTCQELISFLDDYLENTQPPAVREVFDRHLKICGACRDYLKTYRDTVELVRAQGLTPDEPVPPEVPEELVRAVLSARRAK